MKVLKLQIENTVIETFIQLAFWFVLAIPFHEYSHHLTAYLLGGKTWIWMNTTMTEGITGWQLTLVRFAGGYGSSTVLMLLCVFLEDKEEKIACSSVASWQFAYGTFEGLNLLILGSVIAWVIFFTTATLQIAHKYVTT